MVAELLAVNLDSLFGVALLCEPGGPFYLRIMKLPALRGLNASQFGAIGSDSLNLLNVLLGPGIVALILFPARESSESLNIIGINQQNLLPYLGGEALLTSGLKLLSFLDEHLLG
jgi:hypothetical protein